MITPVLALLIFHGLLGGADVLLNHEFKERLPSSVSARTEQALHSARELIFALIFGGLAWFRWNGNLVWIIAGLLLLEFMVSFSDTLLEDRTRRLPLLERAMHVLLLVNFGAYTSLLIPVLMHWHTAPTELVLTYQGPQTWMLSALSTASLLWSVRDGMAFVLLGKKAHAGGRVASQS
jgi:hypothetical protein